jgi:hypothetical protein
LVFLKESFVSCEFLGGACGTNGDFFYDSWFDGNVDFMVGEILAMLPYSKASGAGIGLLNQSICPDGIKSLVSIAHTEAWLGGSKDSCERKSAR